MKKLLKYLKTSYQKVKEGCSSLVANITSLSIGNSAAMGGFVLSLMAFCGVKIKTNAQIYPAIIAAPLTFVLSFSSETIQAYFIKNKKRQLQRDKQLVDQTMDALRKIDLQAAFPDTYQQILTTLGLTDRTQRNSSDYLNQALEQCLQRSLNTNHIGEKLLFGSTTLLNASISTLTGAAGIFVNFIVPSVLRHEEDNQTIATIAITFAFMYSIYATLNSLANADKKWRDIRGNKVELENSITQLVGKLSNLQDQSIIPNNIGTLITSWNDRRTQITANQGQQAQGEQPRQNREVANN